MKYAWQEHKRSHSGANAKSHSYLCLVRNCSTMSAGMCAYANENQNNLSKILTNGREAEEKSGGGEKCGKADN